MARQSVIFAKAVVENSRSETKDRFRRMGSIGGARRPGNRDARCKVQLAAGVVLDFVAQSVAEGQVGLIAPVILNVRFDIELADTRLRIPRIDAERSSAAATSADLCGHKSARQQLQSPLVALNAA